MACTAHIELAIELRHIPWTRDELASLARCPVCNALREPEPTPEEREALFMDPDASWAPPDGVYLWAGYGFAGGGGLGGYLNCDACGFFAKETDREDVTGCVHV